MADVLPPELPVEFLDYEAKYKEDFKTLNLEWIEKYFKVEEPDVQALSHPDVNIIGPGGFIFFARIGSEIVGTIGMMNEGNGIFEMVRTSSRNLLILLGQNGCLTKSSRQTNWDKIVPSRYRKRFSS